MGCCNAKGCCPNCDGLKVLPCHFCRGVGTGANGEPCVACSNTDKKPGIVTCAKCKGTGVGKACAEAFLQDANARLLGASKCNGLEELEDIMYWNDWCCKVDIDAQDDRGNTAANLATKRGHSEFLVELLSLGCNVELANFLDMTPLLTAVKHTRRDRKFEIIKTLVIPKPSSVTLRKNFPIRNIRLYDS